MENLIQFFNDFLEVYLVNSFSLYSIFYLILRIILKKEQKLLSFDREVCRIFPFIGIFYALSFALTFLMDYYDGLTYDQYEIRYLKYIFISSVIWLILSQLFWFKKIQQNITIRIIVSFIGLMTVPKLVMIFETMFLRDYLPSSYSLSISDIVIMFFLQIISILTITSISIGIQKLIKKKPLIIN
ncbi:hypothetical protein [Aureivirga sp. CE67]|uniref:hypothetical protein n=1 Tax=Aureivirga sp. CE67 TaxID=1788983 RepID=UPI0018C9E80F|nr:hypothetical protein [Aureivirga sp. CE67]